MLDAIGLTADPWLLLVVAAVLLAGFLRGFVGFGAALIVVPVLSLVLGPQLAVATCNIMGLLAALQLLPEAVRKSERPVVLPVCAAIFVAAPLGTALLVAVDPGVMKIAISALVLAMVAILASGWRLKGRVGLPKLITAGVTGGIVQGAAGIGGPPVVAVALSRPGTPELQRANVLALMTAITMSSIAPLLWYGLITQRALLIGLILMPFYSLATLLGSRYFALGGQAHYRRAAMATLAVVGVATLAASVWSYGHG